MYDTSIHPPIHPSTHPSIHPPTHPSIHPSIHTSVRPLISNHLKADHTIAQPSLSLGFQLALRARINRVLKTVLINRAWPQNGHTAKCRPLQRKAGESTKAMQPVTFTIILAIATTYRLQMQIIHK